MNSRDLFNCLTHNGFIAVVDSSSVSLHTAFDPYGGGGSQLDRTVDQVSRVSVNPSVESVVNKKVLQTTSEGSPLSGAQQEALHSTIKSDEAQLVALARQRNRAAYQTLVERYQGRLLAAAIDIVQSRADAEDIVQNAFVKAYLSLGSFEGKSSFFTWLYRIVHNLAIDERRRRARHGGETVELESLVGNELNNRITSEGPYDQALRHQQAQAIGKVLSMISEDHRSVIVLREIDGLSYDEIAQALNISRGTVMSRLHYARKKLQQLLKDFAPSDSVSARNSGSDTDEPEQGKINGEKYEHSIKQNA